MLECDHRGSSNTVAPAMMPQEDECWNPITEVTPRQRPWHRVFEHEDKTSMATGSAIYLHLHEGGVLVTEGVAQRVHGGQRTGVLVVRRNDAGALRLWRQRHLQHGSSPCQQSFLFRRPFQCALSVVGTSRRLGRSTMPLHESRAA